MISFNWIKGGMMGGLRMAWTNVDRVNTAGVDPKIRMEALRIANEIRGLAVMLDNQKAPKS